MERETWPHESCLECRLRMPSSDHADAHYRMVGHAMGWPLDVDEMTWPVATDGQVAAALGAGGVAKCSTCGGDGSVAINFGIGSLGPAGIKLCPSCDGTGARVCDG